MPDIRIPKDALVLVGNGAKALFLRNRGTAMMPKLAMESVLEQANPATREQGTDQPGQSVGFAGGPGSALEQTDWHRLAEERFIAEIAEQLLRQAHDNAFTDLVVVAPPRVLGGLRKAMHKTVSERVRAEIPKELTARPIAEIEEALVA